MPQPETTTKPTEPVRLLLRLPRDVHAQLASAAKDDERSLNAQLVYILRQWLKDHP